MANDCPRCGLGTRALLFSFEGRIGRWRYWMFFVPYSIGYLTLIRLDEARNTVAAGGSIGIYSGLFVLLALYSSFAVGVKRCHDRDRSGWFLLVGIVPLLNLWLLVELGFLSGTAGPNRFGLPEPKATWD